MAVRSSSVEVSLKTSRRAKPMPGSTMYEYRTDFTRISSRTIV